MNAALLGDVLARNRAGARLALPSFCTANRLALDAIFDYAAARQLPVLVEATCNQVNQFGGYSGMRAPDYLTFVGTVARDTRPTRRNVDWNGPDSHGGVIPLT